MDFGFMRASADDYKHPNKTIDKVVFLMTATVLTS
jgi:hypothetical protein